MEWYEDPLPPSTDTISFLMVESPFQVFAWPHIYCYGVKMDHTIQHLETTISIPAIPVNALQTNTLTQTNTVLHRLTQGREMVPLNHLFSNPWKNWIYVDQWPLNDKIVIFALEKSFHCLNECNESYQKLYFIVKVWSFKLKCSAHHLEYKSCVWFEFPITTFTSTFSF